VTGDRRGRILARLVESVAPELESKRLCEVCAEVVGVSGAGIMLMSGEVHGGSVCNSNAVSALIEELQYALSEGPCVDAYRHGLPVVEPDLGEPSTARWPAFTGPAMEAGVRAVFGFPLRVGTVRLGALNLYSDRPGSLNDEQHADALVMADVAAQAILAMQADAPPESVAAQLDAGADLHDVVHHASGMVAVQLDVSVDQALIRLKAYAFGNDRSLTEVAQDVVARELRFDMPEAR
jgi:GAF domain-containing protein